MKANTLITLTLFIASYGGVLTGFAAEPLTVEELPTATCCDPIVIYRKVYLNETLPELGARLYDKVDYTLKIRTLTRDIRIAEAELAQQRDRVRVYERDFGNSTALYLTRQDAKLDVVKSEEQLKVLRQEMLLALRYRNDQIRYRKLLLTENAALVQLAK
jgi:hypothetical protein